MEIVVMGASGRVGKSKLKNFFQVDRSSKAVLRDPGKQIMLNGNHNLTFAIADAFDASALTSAFEGADAVFVLIPESFTSEHVLSDVKKMVSNYRWAIVEGEVKKLVGLSSVGSQHESGAGNLSMAYHLEHGFDDFSISRMFVRPAYYFSNWAN